MLVQGGSRQIENSSEFMENRKYGTRIQNTGVNRERE